jgi:flagellar FliJ protein
MAESKYALLLRLAQEKLDAAAERMRRAQAQQNVARGKLGQLSEFLSEYQQRLKNGGVRGMGIGQWRDFQQFLLRLQEAVQTQQGEVDRTIQRYLLERQLWQNERRQLKAFEKLIERERERERIVQTRREQKMTDEFSSRQFWDRTRGDD